VVEVVVVEVEVEVYDDMRLLMVSDDEVYFILQPLLQPLR
jgi:hypothetical protein